MSDTNYLKCSCKRCGEHIEFPLSAAGEQIDCPHCGGSTTLGPEESRAKLGRKLSLIFVFALLVAILMAAVAVFNLSKTHKSAAESSSAITPAATDAVIPKGFTELNDFKISKITLKKAENGGLVNAVGTVKNDSDRQRFGVKITLDLLDEEDNKIGSASDYLAILEPHQEWPFKALLTEPKAVKAMFAGIEEQK